VYGKLSGICTISLVVLKVGGVYNHQSRATASHEGKVVAGHVVGTVGFTGNTLYM